MSASSTIAAALRLVGRGWEEVGGPVLGGYVRLLLWYAPAATGFLLSPPLTAVVCIITSAGWVAWYTRPAHDRRGRRRLDTLRVRRPGGLGWLAGAVVTVPIYAGIAQLLEHALLPVSTPVVTGLTAAGERPESWIAAAALAVVVAPLSEEFVFRGWIQHSLERVIGPAWAIGLASVLFAAAHEDHSIFLSYVLIGVILGFVVHASGSIWAGVLLHAGINIVGSIGWRILPHGADSAVAPPLWQLLGMFAAGSILLAALGCGLARSCRRRALSVPDRAFDLRVAPTRQ